ncbi:arginine/serine-rich protein 1 [Camelus bactrianus]|uniref:arginine/serine-rich protein 1 n=1 Tax=Camelus bactrianus TaxID=9837 RepID=UPI003D6E57C8
MERHHPPPSFPKPGLRRVCASWRPLGEAKGGSPGGERRAAVGREGSHAHALTSLPMRRASASGTFDAFSDARLRSRPDVGGGGVGFAFWERQRKAFLRLQLRKEGVCRAFLSVLREASTACETSFLEEILGEKEARKLSAEMSSYVNDLWPGSPRKASPSSSRSGPSSRLSSASGSRSPQSSRSPSRSSISSRSWSRSRSPPRRRSRSRSHSRRRYQRRYRRYSRSYSRSRSRSRSRRYPERRYGSPRRSCRSRSRSRSRGRSYYRRAYAIARSRRYYGFGRTFYSEERRSWRGRSRTRSRSPSPFRLSEKDRMELLEIAKANAAKTLGTANFDLPASLRTVSVSKETNRGTAVLNNRAKSELSEKLTEDETKNPSGKSSQQKSIAFSSNNSVAKPMLQKSAKATAEETSSGSPKIDKKKSPYGLWIPV